MIKRAASTVSGLVLGILLAVIASSQVGMDGFSGRTSTVALGYFYSLALGSILGLLATRGPWRERGKYAVAGAALGALATFVLRSLPLPWLNLVPLDGTAGMAGELPLVVLPTLGMMLGWVFGAGRPPEEGA